MLNTADNREKGISAAVLKYVALFSMLVDHIGAVFFDPGGVIPFSYPLYFSLRMIGRLAFPIFAFFVVEGFLHTKNRKRYMLQLLLFALLSEIPFDLAFFNSFFAFHAQNVLVTFFLGVLMMQALVVADNQYYLYPVIVLAAAAVAKFLHTDYSWMGICLIAVLFIFHETRASSRNRSLFSPVRIVLSAALTATQGIVAPLAFILLHFYNGKRGRQYKYLFYLFYPLHMLLLWAIRVFLF